MILNCYHNFGDIIFVTIIKNNSKIETYFPVLHSTGFRKVFYSCPFVSEPNMLDTRSGGAGYTASSAADAALDPEIS